MKRHRLVCLKRLSNACLASSPFSNSSRIADNDVSHGVAPNEPSPICNRSGYSGRRRLSNNKIFPCRICQRPHHCLASRRAHESMHANRTPADIPNSLILTLTPCVCVCVCVYEGMFVEYTFLKHGINFFFSFLLCHVHHNLV